jgi:hypothetical protein
VLSSAGIADINLLKTRFRSPISKHVKQLTSQPSGTPESVKLAESLLRTMEQGDVAQLAAELDRVEGVWRHRAAFSSKNAEQLELLNAVAGDLRQSVVRLRKQHSHHLEGVQVHLFLLRHLAHDPGLAPELPQ